MVCKVNETSRSNWSLYNISSYIFVQLFCAILMMSHCFLKLFESCLGNNLIWLWDFAYEMVATDPTYTYSNLIFFMVHELCGIQNWAASYINFPISN